MSVTLDGQRLFDEQLKIELGSVRRGSIEKTAAGLDGELSIDLGKRGREIKQKGVLRAQSASGMDEREAAILAYMDGDTHTLETGSDRKLENLRMESFKITKRSASGGGLCSDYEIVYRQLVV